MKRLLAVALVAGVGLGARTAHARANFDPTLGVLRLSNDAVRTFDFESVDGLVGVQRATWKVDSGFPQLERSAFTNEDIAAMLTSGGEDAIEGNRALRLGSGGSGLLITDPAVLGQLADGRFEVSLWARADGVAPQLWIFYDVNADDSLTGDSPFAMVRGVRTSRETTDGWAEFSTGPLDGRVWNVPVRAIAIVPPYDATAEGPSFLLDAVELSRMPGAPSAPLACTAQTVEAVCGADGDCMYGHCVSSSFTWGILPTPGFRREIAERWVQFGTRFIGDRNAAQNGEHILKPGARALAESAISSRQFFGGLNHLVNQLRDNHTSFGSPANYTNFAPQAEGGSSSVLGACFGIVDEDLLGGGRAYAVFRSTDSPLTGVPLKRGDVLVAIDGRDPKGWVDDLWPRLATALPNDPESDWGSSANLLSRLIAVRASTVTLLRCASSTACGPAQRETFTIDVASAGFKAITSTSTSPSVSKAIGCSQRYLDSVAGAPQGNGSEDPVAIAAGTVGETRVQFDGFVGVKKWQASMTSVFAGAPARVLMDARMGHGGYYNAVQDLLNLLRGTSEPIGVVSMGRGTYDLTDPPWLFDRFTPCSADRGNQWTCFQGNANGFFTKVASAPGGATRIAWLNTYDVSANDFMPRLLKGRSAFKIFGPHATSGAFGSINDMPSLWTGWSGGSLQVQDARFGSDLAAATAARWESSHGVPPDVIIAEKLSDAIDGVDTMLVAATTWLATP